MADQTATPERELRLDLLPEVEEDGKRDEQRGDGQGVTHDGHVEEDVRWLENVKKKLASVMVNKVSIVAC